MSYDPEVANRVLAGLRPFPVAITTVDGGVANGLMSLSAGSASIIPEAPRATISLTKYNKTHDMVVNSGLFVMHMLSAEADRLDKSLEILMTLGGSSGRDGDKIGKLRTKTGETGAPILLDAHSYVEARVVGTLDVEESSIFVGDVVASEILNDGQRLRIGEAWGKLPADWIAQYDANHHPQLENARARRFGAKA
ncbi:flavin reductase family protein (plasmid) [Rhodococcus erythropolis]|uniref:flavin reductase family protein n=1 Tax=Rhodococcus TaxID=1827 RepID=UPI0005AB677E|nr:MULTISPECIES: flavin reductase family protein [Rhodococcus]MCJ0949764.1 flavin reductase family protein [Rhodococcus sp. ARC_M8]MCZ4547313.1 flavin reductase family protein [Rhodococcus qingshengii]MDJ0441085.1 flavin reductase family protein [Rhodococcus qingshengii]MDJ0490000.1 flavin reductase family protein [Rhodococcus qingshengii]OKA12516.1 flavin oxidoreductase [Rhodococcus erythropolis]